MIHRQMHVYVKHTYIHVATIWRMYIHVCTIVHAKIKALLGSKNPMYCTCAMKPFANAAVSAETH